MTFEEFPLTRVRFDSFVISTRLIRRITQVSGVWMFHNENVDSSANSRYTGNLGGIAIYKRVM